MKVFSNSVYQRYQVKLSHFFSDNLTLVEIGINETRYNSSTKTGFDTLIQRIEKHDNVSGFQMNSTNIPWGFLEKHECEWLE